MLYISIYLYIDTYTHTHTHTQTQTQTQTQTYAYTHTTPHTTHHTPHTTHHTPHTTHHTPHTTHHTPHHTHSFCKSASYQHVDSFLLDKKQHGQQQRDSLITSLMNENKRLKDEVSKIAAQNEVLDQNCYSLTTTVKEKEDMIEKLEMQLISNDTIPKPTLVKCLVQAKQEMSKEIHMMSVEIEDLTEKCMALTDMVQVKSDEVEFLQGRIQVLEDERELFINAKEEKYSALVHELSKKIEILNERVRETSEEDDRVAKETSKTTKKGKVEGKNQAEEQIENVLEEERFFEEIANNKVMKENEELKEENKELKELVEFLEMERECTIEEDLIAQESKTADENEKKQLFEENSKLKKEVQTWSKGYAAKMKKEEKLLNELDMTKKRSVKVGHVAKKEMEKRKMATKRQGRITNKPKMAKGIRKEKAQEENELAVAELTDNCEDQLLVQDGSFEIQEDCSVSAKDFTSTKGIRDFTEGNDKLAELIGFLETERKCSLEDVDEVKENVKKGTSRTELQNQITGMKTELKRVTMENEEMKVKLDSLKREFDEERLNKLELERVSELIEEKCEELETRLTNELQRNSTLELKLMEYQGAI